MTEAQHHPSQERLHGFIEESLDGTERAAVDRHLTTCASCRSDVAELRSLFELLGDLPAFAPSTGFAERVMTRVRVPRPAFGWAKEWAGALERLVPHTTRGWAAATGVFALPVMVATLLSWWLLSQPGVNAQSLWLISSHVAADALATSWQWIWGYAAQSSLAVYAARAFELVESVGRGEIGLALVMFATATAASIYVLYQNLFRLNARRTEHASYVF